ncbi:hypothetical protein ABZS66_54805 [Dactylosporangium sp. NPDC005572]|uniref:hypothetical protein n=1 Tax=Dactylosporangium sp. NPDC005572 TaxID=3156889 RepID=UPI0033A16BF5
MSAAAAQQSTALVPAPVTPIVPAQVSSGRWAGGAIEFDRVVPPSGNLQVAGKQFWLGPARSGITVTFWADTDVIHLLIAGTRLKSVRSHLSVNDLAMLLRNGGRPAGPPPLPVAADADPAGAVEVDRTVNAAGHVSLGQHVVLAAEILAGRRVSIRIDAQTLMFLDPDTRELLRTRANPLTPAEMGRLRSARPAGPPPQPPTGPVRVQRRASNTGTVMVAGQKVALGRVHAGKTITIEVCETELAICCDDGTRTIRRTTDQAVTRIKAHRPRKTETLTPTEPACRN